jgi:hypothetical protein
MWQSRSSISSVDEKARAVLVRLQINDPLSETPPKEWIDAQLSIPLSKDHSEPERRVAVLNKLQILIGKEIMDLSVNPDDPV